MFDFQYKKLQNKVKNFVFHLPETHNHPVMDELPRSLRDVVLSKKIDLRLLPNNYAPEYIGKLLFNHIHTAQKKEINLSLRSKLPMLQFLHAIRSEGVLHENSDKPNDNFALLYSKLHNLSLQRKKSLEETLPEFTNILAEKMPKTSKAFNSLLSQLL